MRRVWLTVFTATLALGCGDDAGQQGDPCGDTDHGDTETRTCYDSAWVPDGETCTGSEQVRTCADGQWDPDFGACDHLVCTVGEPEDCGTTLHGEQETRDCFPSDFVPPGETCVPEVQSRTCNDGQWNPDYPPCDYLTCVVQQPGDCGATPNGSDETRDCYDAAVVPPGQPCTMTTQVRTCVDGVWNPDWPGPCITDCMVDYPPAGNPAGTCAVPAEAQEEDTSSPDTVVGNGTPASCTSAEVIAAVAGGGIITFDCGPSPHTITLNQTAKIFNDTGPEIVIDGGGLVTLSGGNAVRILYQNTCDQAQVWTTSHCNNQDHPRLTVQNLTFIDGDATGETEPGGGAIYAQGGRIKIVNSRFFNNTCDPEGPDVGGTVRAFQQYNDLPVYLVNSTFGGRSDLGNDCSNGGGVSSIGVSWTIINSLFSYNEAVGCCGNPPTGGTPGGGSGGAIYNDGMTMTLDICGTLIEHNSVNAHGSAIFFVSNNHDGDIIITDSTITNNLGGSWYPIYPQISCHSDTVITVTNSTIQ